MQWCFPCDALPSSAPSDKETRFILRSSIILFLFPPFSVHSPPISPSVAPPVQTGSKYDFREVSFRPQTYSSSLFPWPSSASFQKPFFPQNFNLSSTPFLHTLLPLPLPPPSPSLLRPWTVMPGVFKNEAEDFPQSFNLGLLQSGTT